MSVTAFCLTSNRLLFLKDFIESFESNARDDTLLVVGAQGCTDGTNDWIREVEHGHFIKKIVFEVFPDNIGLNRYDELVEKWSGKTDIVADMDDDSLFAKGCEDLFEKVLAVPLVGWVSLKQKGVDILRLGNQPREWSVGGERLVEAAAGGAMSATRLETWKELGGFGQGKTIFDPEDARYQRKCIQAGYFTGVLVDHEFEHHGDWEWHIKYGTVQQRMESLHAALMAGFLNEEGYRNIVMGYSEALDKIRK